MNADGTDQTCYGKNSWFPTTILQARNIYGTQKVVAIATGHHSRQPGKLILIDPSRGRQEAQGVQLIAPVRPTPAVRVDGYGQDGELFQYPYPLSETEFLVTYCALRLGPRPRPTDRLRHRRPAAAVCRLLHDHRRAARAAGRRPADFLQPADSPGPPRASRAARPGGLRQDDRHVLPAGHLRRPGTGGHPPRHGEEAPRGDHRFPRGDPGEQRQRRAGGRSDS